MRAISAENQAALEQRLLTARDFLSIFARDRGTGETAYVGFWSDIGATSAEVIDPNTGIAESREFLGAGSSLIAIDDIPAVAQLQVQTVRIRLSQLEDVVTLAVREYEARQARVEIHRGLFHPGGRVMVAPAECRFFGFVDEIEITTPAEGEDGAVTLSCVSHTREMTRANPDTRSHESQIVRAPGDDFFKDAGTVGDWEIFWGKHSGNLGDKSGGGGGKTRWQDWGPVK